MFYEGINATVFRRSIVFAIELVVTLRSSSFEYTMSEHAVHAGAERNVCNIVVSTETPQTTTNSSQTHHQFISNLKYKVSSSGPNILEVYIIYLHVYMCQYMRFCHLSHVPRLRLACAFLKFHLNFHLLTHIYM